MTNNGQVDLSERGSFNSILAEKHIRGMEYGVRPSKASCSTETEAVHPLWLPDLGEKTGLIAPHSG